MKVRDAMSRSVTTVRADTPIPVAASMLHGHGTVPVVDGQGHFVGVAAEADLARGLLVPDGWQVELDPESIVAAVTRQAVVIARPEDDLVDVVAAMLDRGVRSVPVVDGERVVGVLTGTRCEELNDASGERPVAGGQPSGEGKDEAELRSHPVKGPAPGG